MSRHPRLRFLLLVGLFATLNLTGSSLPLQSPPPSFQATGLQAGRGYFGQLPFERVDMINGDLNLIFEDLALPGDGGMDLRIVRTYSRNSWDWKWHVGLPGIPVRIGHPTPPHPNEEALNYPILYMGDGSSRKMWPVGDPWSSTVFVAGDFSRFDSVTRTLTMPNGWAATYESGNPVGGVMLVEVHDVYGNSITPAWEAHSSGYRPFRMTSVTQVTAGQTRTIAFTYPGFWTYSPATMSYHDGTSTRTWTYGVDGEGRFTSVTPPAGPGWTIGYPTNGLTVTTPAGGWVSYTFAQQLTPEDQWVWVVASRTTGGPHIEGGTWTFAFDLVNKIGQVFAPNGVRVEYRHAWVVFAQRWMLDRQWLFDHDAEVARVETDHVVRGLAYEPFVSERRLIRGGKTYTTTFQYAADDEAHHWGDFGRASTITETGDLTRTTTRTFDYSFANSLGYLSRVGGQTVTVAGESFATTFDFEDATGFLQARTDAGITSTFGRDGAGNATTVTDAAGHQTATPYQWGVPAAITTPEYHVSRTIHPDGTVASETRGGVTTAFEYDALGRVTTATPPEGAASVTTYAADGRSVTVSRGPTWTRTDLDGFGRPVGTENAEGVKTVIDYDVEGRRIYQSYPFTGGSHSGDHFAHDVLGRVTRITHPDTTYVQYTYSGTDVTIRDEKDRYTTQTWQAFGDPADARLTTLVDADGKTWAYAYNALGSLTRVTAPEGPDRQWVYNNRNQLESDTQPESGTSRYTYWPDGLLKTKTDALDRLTTYTYDGNHRLTGIDGPGDEDATLSYDGRDNRTGASADGTDSIFGFDGANRLVSREDRLDGQIFISAFAYDARDNLTRITYPSGMTVEYEYDAADRITRVFSGAQTYASAISYHPSGAVTASTFGNLLQATLTDFDARYRPRHLTSGPLDLTYTYDDVGNVTGTVDPRSGFSSSYWYDDLDRLETVTGFGATAFTYDALGNRLSKGDGSARVTYSYSPTTHRLMTATSALGAPETGTFTYDPVGNMFGDGTGTFTYSATNQVRTATLNGATTRYAYDADGLRVQKSSASGKQFFVRGPGRLLLAEYAALLVKLAPASGSSTNTTTVTLKWSGVPGATYEVCWDTINNASCDTGWQANQQQLTRTLSNLTPGTYYWQARATTANGTGQADNGTWWSFTIVEGAFGKLGPAPGAGTGSALTLSWASVPGDPSYFFCFDTTNNSSCDTFWWPNGGTTSVYWDNLAPGTYYWQARVQLPSGQMFDADGGTWWSFMVGSGGSGFGKQTPAPGLSGLPSAVLLQWTAVPNEGYWVCWDTTNNSTCDTGWYPNGGLTWFALDSLAEGTYYWQVKTHDVPMEADSGTWWAFTVGAAPATFGTQTPAHGAILTANATTLWWDAAPGGQFYEVCLDTVNNGVCDTQWQLNGLPTYRALSGLTDGTYYWQVRATTAIGPVYANGGAWWSFTIDAPDPVREYIYLGDTLLADLSYSLTAPPVLTYYHTDVLGSVRAVTSATGAPLARHDYFPFGESTSPLTGDPRRFTGKELDPETALQYFEARYYRNLWGRFTSVDPGQASGSTDDPQGWNAYAYARNNPLKFIDPAGTDYVLAFDGYGEARISDALFGAIERQGYYGLTFRGGFIWDSNSVVVGTYSYHDTLGDFVRGIGQRSQAGLKDGLTEMGVAAATGAVGGLAVGVLRGGLAAIEVLGIGRVAATVRPSAAQIAQMQQVLARQGRAGVEKALRSLERRLAEHLSKIESAGRSGGFTSSIEREVRNFRELIEAAKKVLGK